MSIETVDMRNITLITGGCRSGKSRFAMEAALQYDKRVFMATAPICDEEMHHRVDTHRAQRGHRFTTIETETDLVAAFLDVPQDTDVVLLDCLTAWAGNLMHHHGTDSDSYPEIDAFFELLCDPPVDLLIVTNEVGSSVVPENAMARRFRDLAGNVNRRAAAAANRVVLLVCGIPVTIK